MQLHIKAPTLAGGCTCRSGLRRFSAEVAGEVVFGNLVRCYGDKAMEQARTEGFGALADIRIVDEVLHGEVPLVVLIDMGIVSQR